jgi:hypothetical protein
MRKPSSRHAYRTVVLPFVGGNDFAANLAHFLHANAGSIWGCWEGHMKAADQRALFGRFLGKGLIVISGESETIKMYVKVCFGCDFDVRENLAWRDL